MFSASQTNPAAGEGPRHEPLADARARQSRQRTDISATGQTGRPAGFGALLLTRFGARVPSTSGVGAVAKTRGSAGNPYRTSTRA